MTDPMELVGRLENIATGSFPYVASAAAEAAACIREMVEWRPIETAPRDGTTLLAWENGDWIVCHWHKSPSFSGGWVTHWETASGYDVGWNTISPTHWLPLPPAPGAEA